MKQTACVLVFLILAGVPASADKMRVAVVDFQARGIPVSVAQNVSELVRNEMINTGLYTVIERSQMGEILKEQGIQQTGCTDLSCAVEIGKVLSANKIMLGTVMKMGGSIIITGRIVDVQSGMGEFSESQDAASESVLYAAVKLFTERLSARIQGKALESMPAQPLPAKGIEGEYSARGTNPDGSTYSGTCTVSKTADGYVFHWRIGSGTFDGKGSLSGKTLTVDWGQAYPVIYTVEGDGRLVGTWADGAATETLTRR